MQYPKSIRQAEVNIDKGLRFLQQARQELEELKEQYRKYNQKLPRKNIAKLIGCTPEHVSRLKREGRLKSYRAQDVKQYLEKRRMK